MKEEKGPPACGGLCRDICPHFGEFALEAAGEDGEAAPGLGVEVLVVDVERRGVALALPLVAAPQVEEPLDPDAELGGRVLRELAAHELVDLDRDLLVADGGPFDGVE